MQCFIGMSHDAICSVKKLKNGKIAPCDMAFTVFHSLQPLFNSPFNYSPHAVQKSCNKISSYHYAIYTSENKPRASVNREQLVQTSKLFAAAAKINPARLNEPRLIGNTSRSRLFRPGAGCTKAV